MRPGTVAYIPRGTWHHTRTPGNQTSISVALFVRSPRTVDAVLEVLRLELAQLAPWRRPLRNPHLAPDDRVALQARLDELPARVAGLLSQKYVSEGRAVLLSSHILDMLERICSRVVVLHRGKLVADLDREGLAEAFENERTPDLTRLYLDLTEQSELIAEFPG